MCFELEDGRFQGETDLFTRENGGFRLEAARFELESPPSEHEALSFVLEDNRRATAGNRYSAWNQTLSDY